MREHSVSNLYVDGDCIYVDGECSSRANGSTCPGKYVPTNRMACMQFLTIECGADEPGIYYNLSTILETEDPTADFTSGFVCTPTSNISQIYIKSTCSQLNASWLHVRGLHDIEHKARSHCWCFTRHLLHHLFGCSSTL